MLISGLEQALLWCFNLASMQKSQLLQFPLHLETALVSTPNQTWILTGTFLSLLIAIYLDSSMLS